MAPFNPTFFISSQIVADMTKEDIKTVQERLTLLRKHLNKRPRSKISITDYCLYESIDRREVENYVNEWYIRNRRSNTISINDHQLRKAS